MRTRPLREHDPFGCPPAARPPGAEGYARSPASGGAAAGGSRPWPPWRPPPRGRAHRPPHPLRSGQWNKANPAQAPPLYGGTVNPLISLPLERATRDVTRHVWNYGAKHPAPKIAARNPNLHLSTPHLRRSGSNNTPGGRRREPLLGAPVCRAQHRRRRHDPWRPYLARQGNPALGPSGSPPGRWAGPTPEATPGGVLSRTPRPQAAPAGGNGKGHPPGQAACCPTLRRTFRGPSPPTASGAVTVVRPPGMALYRTHRLSPPCVGRVVLFRPAPLHRHSRPCGAQRATASLNWGSTPLRRGVLSPAPRPRRYHGTAGDREAMTGPRSPPAPPAPGPAARPVRGAAAPDPRRARFPDSPWFPLTAAANGLRPPRAAAPHRRAAIVAATYSETSHQTRPSAENAGSGRGQESTASPVRGPSTTPQDNQARWWSHRRTAPGADPTGPSPAGTTGPSSGR